MSNTSKQPSDSNFYLVMLAAVVGMGFYVSYDVDKRYGSSTAAVEAQPEAAPIPVVVEVEVVTEVVETPPVVETAPAASEPVVEIIEIKKETIIKDPETETIVKTETAAKFVETNTIVEAETPAEVETQPIPEAVITEAAEVVKTITKYIPVPMPVKTRQQQPQNQHYQGYRQPYQGGNYYQQPYQNTPYGNYQQVPYDYNPYQQPGN